jgi:hypothetical protein
MKKDGFKMRARSIISFAGLASGVVGPIMGLILAGCGPRERPNFTYMPDMHYSPAIKAQEEGSMRPAPAGTLPRGQVVYPYPATPEGALMADKNPLKNPLPRTLANLKRGQDMFNVYCGVCHGPFGEGDGSVVPKFPRPPSLQSDKVKQWPDGRIYHVIMAGQNLMPSYASQVDPDDRWKIIHYIRVLQRAKNPTAQDLEQLKNW